MRFVLLVGNIDRIYIYMFIFNNWNFILWSEIVVFDKGLFLK